MSNEIIPQCKYNSPNLEGECPAARKISNGVWFAHMARVTFWTTASVYKTILNSFWLHMYTLDSFSNHLLINRVNKDFIYLLFAFSKQMILGYKTDGLLTCWWKTKTFVEMSDKLMTMS